MDRDEGGSSPDTVIARSSSEEDRKRRAESTSGDYVTVEDSSSSLDTLTGAGGGVVAAIVSGATEEKKKGRFGALKSSFKKEGGFFKIKRKGRANEGDPGHDVDQEDDEKESARKKSTQQPLEEEEDRKRSGAVQVSPTPDHSSTAQQQKKKKKKGHSLVRKLSLNKFRISGEQHQQHQEITRQTPEGGDSSRSQSQSSQDSPSYSDSPSRISRKGQQGVERIIEKERSVDRASQKDDDERRRRDDRREEGEREKTTNGEEPRKLEKLIEKPVSTVTVVQRRSPSLTIRSTPRTAREHDGQRQIAPADRPQREDHEAPSIESGQCASTLPYAVSKWPDQRRDAKSSSSSSSSEFSRKAKLSVKSDSESAASKASPIELRRKLSLLEEKRAIFQRRLFDTTCDTDSGETVIAVTLDDEEPLRSRESPTKELKDEQTGNVRKRVARHISVRTFDTFSTFDRTFDEDTGLGYLAGIEEDYTESYNDDYTGQKVVMGPMVGAGDSLERTARSLSQESSSSQNNAASAGVGEKREHLYKILVIGELGAGKTSIIKRYVHQFFSQHYRATIGVDFALKVLNWDPHTIIRLQLWDIAGQERFGNMTRVYYKEAVGAFIVFDVTRSETLNAVVKWKQDLDSKVQLPDGSPIPCVLLANKCDQQKEDMVNSPTKMDEYCREKNFAGWFETSAKENINIEEAARFLVNKILQNDQIMKGNGSQEQADGERFALNQSPSSSKKSCTC